MFKFSAGIPISPLFLGFRIAVIERNSEKNNQLGAVALQIIIRTHQYFLVGVYHPVMVGMVFYAQ